MGEGEWGRAIRRVGADRLALALALGALAIAFFAGLFFVAGNEPDGHCGLLQRLALAAGAAWIAALASALLDLYGERASVRHQFAHRPTGPPPTRR